MSRKSLVIPDLLTEARTSLDAPFHLSGFRMKPKKGKPTRLYLVDLDWGIDKEDGSRTVLPNICRNQHAAVVSALDNEGALSWHRDPNVLLSVRLMAISGAEQTEIFDERPATLRRVKLTAAKNKARLRYTLGFEGLRLAGQLEEAFDASVLIFSKPSQGVLAFPSTPGDEEDEEQDEEQDEGDASEEFLDEVKTTKRARKLST